MKKILYNGYYILSFFIVILVSCLIYFTMFFKLDSEKSFFKNINYIGHATYGIDNIDYTNSKESLKFGYDKGIRVMEVDFLFTSDDELVLNHYWMGNTWESSEHFLESKVNNVYTPMSLSDLLEYMDEYEDLYIIIDTKENEYDNNKSIYDVYKKIVNETLEYDSKLLDRFIVQIYGFNDLKIINDIHDFENKMFSMYKLGDRFNIASVVYYCLYNDIDSLVIPYTHIMYNLLDEKDINFIRSKGINVYVNTINDKTLYKELVKMGVTGVYTDFLN